MAKNPKRSRRTKPRPSPRFGNLFAGSRKALGLILTLVVGFWVTTQLGPELMRRLPWTDPVIVNYSLVLPNGENYTFVTEKKPNQIGVPPSECREWHNWAKEYGGADVLDTMLEFSIQGNSDITVLIRDVRVKVLERKQQPTGTAATCGPTGGADTIIRNAQVDLTDSQPSVTFCKDEQCEETLKEPRQFQLRKGEIEVFRLVADAQQGLYAWVAEVDMIADGKEQIKTVDDDGRPFQTAGFAGSGDHIFWDNDNHEWSR